MRSSLGLDNRRKRILYRGWHRGMRELDLIFGSYLDKHIEKLSNEQLTELETMLEIPENKLYAWFCGNKKLPADFQNSLLADILNFYQKQKTPKK